MKTTGLITEYNPFHKGHIYHLEQSKLQTGADTVIVIMSGNFVQRGAPAYMDKYTRTEVALKHGADLVLELPFLYACSSAELFARGAVSILNRIGITDTICFGTEDASIADLKKAANILTEEPFDFQTVLKEYLKSGLSFPTARKNAFASLYPELVYCLESPNNILGLEYLKALISLKSEITPYTLKRICAGYHDCNPDSKDRFYSASALRSISDDAYLLSDLSEIDPLYLRQYHHTFPVSVDDFDILLGQKLLSVCHANTLTDYADVSEDLANAIKNHISEYQGFHQFVSVLKNKSLTYTRISRSLLHILFDVKTKLLQEAVATNAPGYVRVLGFSKKGRELLGKMEKNITVLVKTSDYRTRLTSPTDRMIFEQNLMADDIYRMILMHKYGDMLPTEFNRRVLTVSI